MNAFNLHDLAHFLTHEDTGLNSPIKILLAAAVAVLALAGPEGAAGPGSGAPEASAWLPEPAPAQPGFAEILALENGRDTGERLRSLARDADPLLRARALRALARAQERDLLPVFTAALADPEAAVRHEAVLAVGLLWGDGDAAPLMARYAAEPDARVREALIEAIGRCAGSDEGITFLAGLVPAPDTLVAARAALALGVAGYRKVSITAALPALTAATRHRAGSVRWAAAYAFFRGAPDEGVNATRLLLKDRDPLARLYAVRTIAAAKRTSLAAAVSELARDPDWRVRVEALKALPALKGHVLFSLAGLNVDDPVPVVQVTAIETLGDLHTDQGLTYLQRILNESEDDALRGAAIVAKTKIQQDGALPDLKRWRGSTNPAIRRACAQAFGLLRSDQARALLAEMITDQEPSVLAEVVSALSEYPQLVSLADIRSALRSDDIAVLTNAASALGQRRDRTSITALCDVFDRLKAPSDVEPMVEIARALGRIASPTDTAVSHGVLSPESRAHAVATLKAGIADTDLNVARACAEALQVIDGKDHSSEIPAASAAPGFPLHSAEIAAPPARQARIVTPRGEIVFELFPGAAPNTVANFVRLAASGYFNGLNIHRVVPGFVTQDGDPRGDGWGGPGYAIRCEYNDLRYDTGMVGMALSGKDTGGSQYFITHAPQPHLDGRYTIFGRVVSGLEVLPRLLRGERVDRVELIP